MSDVYSYSTTRRRTPFFLQVILLHLYGLIAVFRHMLSLIRWHEGTAGLPQLPTDAPRCGGYLGR